MSRVDEDHSAEDKQDINGSHRGLSIRPETDVRRVAVPLK